MSQGKDLAWKPIAYCAAALVLGVVVGTFLVAPTVKKLQEKNQAKSKIKEIPSKG